MAALGYDRTAPRAATSGPSSPSDLGRVAPDHVIGVHVNAATFGFIPWGEVSEEELASVTDVERARVDRLNRYQAEQSGYFQLQSTRPQTIAHALADSPVGQLAWIVEKFQAWTSADAALPEDAVPVDDLLTDVSVYWFTNSAGSSADIYWESMHAGSWPTPSGVPTGVAVFGQDVAIRRYAEQGHAIVHWSDFAKGGHFAAMETRTCWSGTCARSSPALSRDGSVAGLRFSERTGGQGLRGLSGTHDRRGRASGVAAKLP